MNTQKHHTQSSATLNRQISQFSLQMQPSNTDEPNVYIKTPIPFNQTINSTKVKTRFINDKAIELVEKEKQIVHFDRIFNLWSSNQHIFDEAIANLLKSASEFGLQHTTIFYEPNSFQESAKLIGLDGLSKQSLLAKTLNYMLDVRNINKDLISDVQIGLTACSGGQVIDLNSDSRKKSVTPMGIAINHRNDILTVKKDLTKIQHTLNRHQAICVSVYFKGSNIISGKLKKNDSCINFLLIKGSNIPFSKKYGTKDIDLPQTENMLFELLNQVEIDESHPIIYQYLNGYLNFSKRKDIFMMVNPKVLPPEQVYTFIVFAKRLRDLYHENYSLLKCLNLPDKVQDENAELQDIYDQLMKSYDALREEKEQHEKDCASSPGSLGSSEVSLDKIKLFSASLSYEHFLNHMMNQLTVMNKGLRKLLSLMVTKDSCCSNFKESFQSNYSFIHNYIRKSFEGTITFETSGNLIEDLNKEEDDFLANMRDLDAKIESGACMNLMRNRLEESFTDSNLDNADTNDGFSPILRHSDTFVFSKLQFPSLDPENFRKSKDGYLSKSDSKNQKTLSGTFSQKAFSLMLKSHCASIENKSYDYSAPHTRQISEAQNISRIQFSTGN